MSDTHGRTIAHDGVTLGSVLAVVISWSVNKSILWMLLHGIFGWGYVIYYALGYGRTP
jgi:hypothetical protein